MSLNRQSPKLESLFFSISIAISIRYPAKINQLILTLKYMYIRTNDSARSKAKEREEKKKTKQISPRDAFEKKKIQKN